MRRQPAGTAGTGQRQKGASRVNVYLDLYLTFARMGALTFGGGYAMLPILQREVVENRHWATDDEIMDYYAVGQCTPGVIAINTSTFIGYKLKGIPGAIIASLGFLTPSIIIITIIAAFISNFADLAVVKNAFAGIRVCVCVLILNAIIKLFKKAVVDIPTWIIFLIVFILSVVTDLSPALFVIVAGVAGVLIKKVSTKEPEASGRADGQKEGR